MPSNVPRRAALAVAAALFATVPLGSGALAQSKPGIFQALQYRSDVRDLPGCDLKVVDGAPD